MTLHPDLKTPATQNGRDASQGLISVFKQFRLATVEEPNFAQADHQALGSDPHLDFMLADFVTECALELTPQFVHVDPEAGPVPSLSFRSAGDLNHLEWCVRELGAQYCRGFPESDTFGRRAGEHTQLSETLP